MPYEPFLWGVGVVFNLLKNAQEDRHAQEDHFGEMTVYRERKKRIKNTHMKNVRGSQGGGLGGGVFGVRILYAGVNFPSKIERIKNFRGGGWVSGCRRGSKVQFWGSFLYVCVLFQDMSLMTWFRTGSEHSRDQGGPK